MARTVVYQAPLGDRPASLASAVDNSQSAAFVGGWPFFLHQMQRRWSPSGLPASRWNSLAGRC